MTIVRRIIDDRDLERLVELVERWEESACRSLGTTVREFFAGDTMLAERPELLATLEEFIRDSQAFAEFDRDHDDIPEIPGFVIQGEIGRGGMGVVFKARDVKLGRQVAVKVLPESAFLNPDNRRRLEAEADTIAKLAHPHIVSLLQYGETDRSPYLVMELVPGGNAAVLWAVNRPAPLAAARRMETVARAVAFAHENGIIHRDIKPSNILIARDGALKIGDFGIAKDLASGAQTRTGSGPIGTAKYMAPEQMRGQCDARSDVYGLGATLYFALTGRPPFEGDSDLDVFQQLRNDSPLPPRKFLPGVPRDLETICLKCLEREPARRYQSARELADDLERFHQHRPIVARPVGKLERTWRWCRREPWRAAALGAGVLTCVIMLVLIGQQRRAAARDEQRRREVDAEIAKVRLLSRLESQRAHQRSVDARLQGDPAGAAGALEGLPSEHVSWDTRRLLLESGDVPGNTQTLAHSFWRILAGTASPDGTQVATADAGGQLYVWNADTGRIERQLRMPRRVTPPERLPRGLHVFESQLDTFESAPQCGAFVDLKWSADGRSLWGASVDGAGWRFDFRDGSERQLIKIDRPLVALAIDARRERVMFGSDAGDLYLVGFDGVVVERLSGAGDAVVSLQYLALHDRWIVGQRSGTIRWLEAGTLAKKYEVNLPAPLWRLATCEDAEGTDVAIACGGASIFVARLSADLPHRLRLDTIPLVRRDAPVEAVHDIYFADDIPYLLAIDSHGVLWCVDRATKSVTWKVADATPPESREPQIRESIRKREPEFDFPFWYARVSAGLIIRPQQREFFTMGRGATIRRWTNPRVGAAPDSNLVIDLPPTSAAPRLAFDGGDSSKLWALSGDGKLALYDVERGRLLHRVQAHRAKSPRADVCVATNPARVLTAGGDRSVRLWQTQNGRIVPVSTPRLTYDADVLSVSISPDGSQVASVDRESRLWVRSLATGKQLFMSPLDTEAATPPLTGRVAYNADGSWLAAFGAGQTAALFQTRPFRRVPEQIWVAGDGGIALRWSPNDPTLVLAADTDDRLEGRFVAGPSSQSQSRLGELLAIGGCAAIGGTADGKRIVLLRKGGVADFVDSVALARYVTGFDTGGLDHDLAFSPNGRWMAVAGREGTVKVWDCAPRDESIARNPPDETSRWNSQDLVTSDNESLIVAHQGANRDSSGVVRATFIRSRPNDFRGEGALEYLEHSGGTTSIERLEIGDEYDRRICVAAATLVPDWDGKPAVLFRRRISVQSPYDGQLWIARREKPSTWLHERVVDQGNHGFYPAVARDRAGSVREILHFSFEQSGLMRSRRLDAEPRTWAKPTLFGERGWGFRMESATDRQGVMHCLFNSHRFSGDGASYSYARRVDDKFEVEALDRGIAMALAMGPDDQAVVMIRTTNQSKSDVGFRCMTGDRPDRYATIRRLETVYDFAIAPDGSLLIPEWRRSTGQFVLWTVSGKRASAAVVAELPTDRPFTWRTLGVDSTGRRAILIWGRDEGRGWIRLVSSKQP